MSDLKEFAKKVKEKFENDIDKIELKEGEGVAIFWHKKSNNYDSKTVEKLKEKYSIDEIDRKKESSSILRIIYVKKSNQEGAVKV